MEFVSKQSKGANFSRFVVLFFLNNATRLLGKCYKMLFIRSTQPGLKEKYHANYG